MLAAARRAHPNVRFEEGRLDELPFPDSSLAGAVSWYSIIYTPPDLLNGALTELQRVLAPGAHLLLAFQAGGGESVMRRDAYGTSLSLVSHRHGIDDVASRLKDAGFAVHARAQRVAAFVHESTPQAFVIARRARPQEADTQ